MYIATRPGRTDKPNEDYVGANATAAATCAVLLDGAGGPSELPTGCRHGTPWYVAHLGDRLLLNMRNPRLPLTAALAQAIDAVSRAHAVVCDLGNPGTPSSTVVMTRLAHGQLDYLVLGDSTFVADLGPDRDILVVSDKRIDAVGADLYAAMAALPTGTPEHQAARIAFVTHQRLMRNKPAGYWIASNDPEAAYHAHTGHLPADQARQIAVLSDGATRYVEFGLGNWRDLLHVLAAHGPDELFDRVRRAEESDPAGQRWPRAKRRDDVAAAWVPLQRRPELAVHVPT